MLPNYSPVYASGDRGRAGRFSGIRQSIGGLAPALLAGFGSSLGGSSTTGGALGGAGGLIGGTLLSGLITSGSIGGATTGGIFGSTAGLFGLSGAATFGIGAGIAGALMLGSWLLGRSKQRKADEKTRTTTINDAFRQIDDLIKAVQSDRADGQSSIANANSIRSQYLEAVSQLKDKKTRNIAIKDVSRVDSRIELLKQAAAAQDKRREVGKQWTPEFAKGGYVRAFSDGGRMLPYGYSRIGGAFDAKDDLLFKASRGEHTLVMNPNQWNAVGHKITPHLKQAKVPGFATGGSPNMFASSTTTTADDGGELHLTIEKAYIDSESIVFEGMKANRNKKVVFHGVKQIMTGKANS